MDEYDIDTLLAIIGDPIRRQILRKLVKETHYPLQLSRELRISQQAIMKHLEVLEKNELVKSDFQKSDSGGPPRRYYVPTKSFTIMIDLGPEFFSEELRLHDDEQVIEGVSDVTSLSNAKNLRIKLAEFSQRIADANRELETIKMKRDKLMADKKEAISVANQIIDTFCNEYAERKVLRYLIAEDDITLTEMSNKLNMRESEIEKILKKLDKKGLLIMNR